MSLRGNLRYFPPISLRKIAFWACVVSATLFLVGTWQAAETMILVFERNRSLAWKTAPVMILAVVILSAVPLFYFALFRNESVVNVPPRLRQLTLIGVLMIALSIGVGIPQVVETFHLAWSAAGTINWEMGGAAIAAIGRYPAIVNGILIGLREVSSVIAILVLLVLLRLTNEEFSITVPVTSLLSFATKFAVIGLGLFAAFNLLRLVFSPVQYFALHRYAVDHGLKSLTLIRLLAEANQGFLVSAGNFAAPYIVYRSLPPSKPTT